MAVAPQKAKAEPRDQQAPLQFHVVTAQPGVGLDHHQLGTAALAGPGALAPQGLGQLGDEGQGAKAPPQFMADGADQQQHEGHDRAPKKTIARKGCVGNQQGGDQGEPATDQQSTHETGMLFWKGAEHGGIAPSA
ncbi:MAG: hypothetical protein VKP70_08925 [Cyanobacteriota bacterium]|nr:hypothetical protein [Cyanobacteriota bacterium]